MLKSWMKAVAFASVLACVPTAAHAAPVRLAVAGASLWGTQEVPPHHSPATGHANLSVWEDNGARFIQYEMVIRGIDFAPAVDGDPNTNPVDPLDATGLHFHVAPRGVNGPIVFGMFNPDHDFDDDTLFFHRADDSWLIRGTWDPGEGNPAQPFGDVNAAAAAILAVPLGEDLPFYVNVHTVAHPMGEIRGQFERIPEVGTIGILGLGIPALVALRRRKAAA